MIFALFLAVLVWFAPLDPLFRPQLGYGGAPDYMALFQPNAPWAHAASRVQVFKIYPQWAEQATDAQLRAQLADLKHRNIALAVEYGALTAPATCGQGVEGFGGEKLTAVARRIESLGGTLAYVAMDEPFFWSTIYAGPGACRWTPDEAAANAAVNIRALRTAFPEVRIGDVEPAGFTDLRYVAQYRACLEAFKRDLGFAPAFFHVDEQWNPRTFPADLVAVKAMTADEGVPFGLIVDGFGNDRSDAAWISTAAAHLTAAEAAIGVPDELVFQSWHPYPRTLLPETDPDAFTALIDRFVP